MTQQFVDQANSGLKIQLLTCEFSTAVTTTQLRLICLPALVCQIPCLPPLHHWPPVKISRLVLVCVVSLLRLVLTYSLWGAFAYWLVLVLVLVK
jgi:hypothetical protein